MQQEVLMFGAYGTQDAGRTHQLLLDFAECLLACQLASLLWQHLHRQLVTGCPEQQGAGERSVTRTASSQVHGRLSEQAAGTRAMVVGTTLRVPKKAEKWPIHSLLGSLVDGAIGPGPDLSTELIVGAEVKRQAELSAIVQAPACCMRRCCAASCFPQPQPGAS